MGQYYLVVNVDKKEYLDPLKFNDGLKLLEIVGSRSFTLSGLALLLADGNGRGGGDIRCSAPHDEWVGRWSGDRIVVAGDYADDLKFVPQEDLSRFAAMFPETIKRMREHGRKGPNLYEVADSLYRDISEHVLAVMLEDSYLKQDLLDDLVGIAKVYRSAVELFGGNQFAIALQKALKLRNEKLDLYSLIANSYCPR